MTASTTYNIGTAEISIDIPQFTQVGCAETETLTVWMRDGTTAVPSYVKLDLVNRKIKVQTSDTSLNSSINYRVTSTLSNSKGSANADFSVVYTNPCSATTLTSPGALNISV